MSTATTSDERWIWLSGLIAPLTCCFGISAVAIALTPVLPELLQFDAAAIVEGEYWRFLTGHLVHWNFDHLFWDVSVFVVLGTMCERRSRKAFLACVLGSAAAISLYTLVVLPELPIYRGLSGIDTGLFALLGVGLFADARARGNRTMQWLIVAAMLGLIAKTAYEFTSDATIFVDHTTAAFVPITMAHVLGAFVGCAVGLAAMTWDRVLPQLNSRRAVMNPGRSWNERSSCGKSNGRCPQSNVTGSSTASRASPPRRRSCKRFSI